MKTFQDYLEAAGELNALSKAIKIISAKLKENPEADRLKLIEKACQQTNCNPKQEEYLINKYNEAYTRYSGPATADAPRVRKPATFYDLRKGKSYTQSEKSAGAKRTSNIEKYMNKSCPYCKEGKITIIYGPDNKTKRKDYEGRLGCPKCKKTIYGGRTCFKRGN